MFNISFDISETVQEFSLQQVEVDSLSNYLLDRIVDEIMGRWDGLVDSSLNTTRDEYRRAMYTDRPDDRTAIIGLTARDSKLAMMIETGAEAFDEKIGFSNSELKHMKKDGGWYLTIPFRHATSEAIMGMMVPEMNVSVLDFMKSGGMMEQGNLPEPFNEIQTHEIKLNTGSLITYKHKAPIHEGMHRRDISSTEKEKRGGYFTFRRVSDNSDPESWIHPGLQARGLMEKAIEESHLDQVVDNSVQDWLDTKFGE